MESVLSKKQMYGAVGLDKANEQCDNEIRDKKNGSEEHSSVTVLLFRDYILETEISFTVMDII